MISEILRNSSAHGPKYYHRSPGTRSDAPAVVCDAAINILRAPVRFITSHTLYGRRKQKAGIPRKWDSPLSVLLSYKRL